MRKARGYSIVHDPAFSLPQEQDTLTCQHCNQIIEKPPFKSVTDDIAVNGRRRPIGGWCYKCDSPICIRCARKGVCVPVEMWCEQIEAKAHYDELLGRK